MLGELNWIFTAITDTIAWNSLPRGTIVIFESLKKCFYPIISRHKTLQSYFSNAQKLFSLFVSNFFSSSELFQKLFRQDLLVASLFRNFLLAERIMRSYNCIPISNPKLPSTHQHTMW